MQPEWSESQESDLEDSWSGRSLEDPALDAIMRARASQLLHEDSYGRLSREASYSRLYGTNDVLRRT